MLHASIRSSRLLRRRLLDAAKEAGARRRECGAVFPPQGTRRVARPPRWVAPQGWRAARAPLSQCSQPDASQDTSLSSGLMPLLLYLAPSSGMPDPLADHETSRRVVTSIPKLPLPSRDTTTAAPLASDADLLTPRFLALLESELPTSTQPPHKLSERDLAATHREELYYYLGCQAGASAGSPPPPPSSLSPPAAIGSNGFATVPA